MKQSWYDILVSTVALTVIAGAVTAALSATNALTADKIQQQTEETENAARLAVIQAGEFRQEVLATDGAEITYYIALDNGETVGYVFTATTAGKSAGLTVMTGISAEGVITGVEVTDDNETAGYVDKVIKAGYLDKLVGHRAVPITDVDAVSQATKTSNGIRQAVDQAVAWYQLAKEGGAHE